MLKDKQILNLKRGETLVYYKKKATGEVLVGTREDFPTLFKMSVQGYVYLFQRVLETLPNMKQTIEYIAVRR